MRWILVAPVVLGLAACGTPQEQCIGSVSHDMTVLDRLIAETQGNVTRGYAYEDTVISTPEFVDCTPDPTTKHPSPRPRTCLDEVERTVTRPVAIDLTAEEAKLDSMRKRRDEMARSLAPAIADCRARYPE